MKVFWRFTLERIEAPESEEENDQVRKMEKRLLLADALLHESYLSPEQMLSETIKECYSKIMKEV